MQNSQEAPVIISFFIKLQVGGSWKVSLNSIVEKSTCSLSRFWQFTLFSSKMTSKGKHLIKTRLICYRDSKATTIGTMNEWLSHTKHNYIQVRVLARHTVSLEKNSFPFHFSYSSHNKYRYNINHFKISWLFIENDSFC